MESVSSAVVLSRGGTWNPEPDETPYLHPAYSKLKAWPDGSARITFSDTAGVELLDLFGEVSPHEIRFRGEADDMDKIPHGANFHIILDTNDGSRYPIRHGKVHRKEVFFATPPAQRAVEAVTFTDNFQRTALGRLWLPIKGNMQMNDNGDSLPIGVGPKDSPAAIRYQREFGADGVEIGITVLNRTPGTAAWAAVLFCADITGEHGIAAVLSTNPNNVRIGSLTSPTSWVERDSAANTIANNDYYRIRYLDEPRTVAIYKGTSLEPIGEWVDNAAEQAHGPGYRHVLLAGDRANGSTLGVQVTSISARDAA